MKAAQERDRGDEPDRGEEDAAGRSGKHRGACERADVVEHVGEKADEAAPDREHLAPGAGDERRPLEGDASHGSLSRPRSRS